MIDHSILGFHSQLRIDNLANRQRFLTTRTAKRTGAGRTGPMRSGLGEVVFLRRSGERAADLAAGFALFPEKTQSRYKI
jgi:hypothetical protein